jgi:hypothetical protein
MAGRLIVTHYSAGNNVQMMYFALGRIGNGQLQLGTRKESPSASYSVLLTYNLLLNQNCYRNYYNFKYYFCQLTYSVALVRKRTILTERQQLVGEVSANFCGLRVPRGQRDGSLRPYSRLSRLNITRTLAQTTSLQHSHKVLH